MPSLLPDHFHLVWIGLRPDSDQRNAMAFLRTHLKPSLAPHHRLQPQAYDHVLREEDRQPEAFAAVCDYVLANPERKQLVSRWQDWPFCGAVLPGYPTLHPARDDYWEKFWKLSAQLREEIAKRAAPPRLLTSSSTTPPWTPRSRGADFGHAPPRLLTSSSTAATLLISGATGTPSPSRIRSRRSEFPH